MVTMLEMIQAKEAEFKPRRDRWDSDQDLIDNVAFTLKNWDDKANVERVFNVTLPNAAIFYSKMVALIAGVKRQPVVESQEEMKDKDRAHIIDFLQDADFEIDALLSNKNKRDAFTTHSGYICGRGWIVDQCLIRMDKGELIMDVRPLDPYGFTFATDRKGMVWGSIKMKRSKVDIENEYNGFKVSADTGIVRETYNRELRYVHIDDKQIVEEDNPYGYPPFVVEAVPYGTMLTGEDTIKGEGESIFFPHRNMFAEMNWMATVIKTQAFDDLRPALQQVGDKLAAELERYPKSSEIATTDNPLVIVPRRDMSNSMRTYMGIVSGILQRAGLSAINEGTLTFPIAAVLFARLMAERNSLTLPRHQALGHLYTARTRMILTQLIDIGGSFELGQEGMKRKYEASKLEGQYTISWQYTVDSLEDRATRQAIANAEVGTLSQRTIRKETLQLENPEQEENFMEIEAAKRREPLITDIERMHSLIDENTEVANDEAWILYQKIDATLKQRNLSGVVEGGAVPPPKPQQQLSVFGGGGGGGGGGAQPTEGEGGQE